MGIVVHVKTMPAFPTHLLSDNPVATDNVDNIAVTHLFLHDSAKRDSAIEYDNSVLKSAHWHIEHTFFWVVKHDIRFKFLNFDLNSIIIRCESRIVCFVSMNNLV